MTRVLVTGASGAFGSAVVALLRSDPSFDVYTAGRTDADFPFDLDQVDGFGELIESAKPNWVLHLAAHFPYTVEEAYSRTVLPAKKLLDAVQLSGLPVRVLLIGSAAEYGAISPQVNPVREDQALQPVSAYGLGKAWQSALVSLYAAQGVDVLQARVFNLEGPSMPERLFVGRVQAQIAEIRSGHRMAIEVGPLGAIRDYVDVQHAARQLVAIAKHGIPGKTYHVASGMPVQMRTVLNQQLQRAGLSNVEVRESPALSNRPGIDVPEIYADISSTRILDSTASPMKLAVVAPVFNEEQAIAHFHDRTRAVLDSMVDVSATIVYVVDRCTDNTMEVLRTIVARSPLTRVISLSSRFGHQMSLLAGIENAVDADAIIMMDSDLQHPPELIPKLVEKYRAGFDVVYTLRKDTEDAGFLRKRAGDLFYYGLGKISEAPVNPNAADFRLISQRVAKLLSTGFKERNVFLRGLFPLIGFRQCGVDYVAEKRFAGHSKYSASRMIKLATAGILSSSTKPLQLSIFMGSAFAALAFLLILYSVIEFFLDRTIPSGWTTLVVLLLLFSGIQLFVIGIVGAYVGGVYEEVKNRPRYIIDEILDHA